MAYRACVIAPLYDDQTIFWYYLRSMTTTTKPFPLSTCPAITSILPTSDSDRAPTSTKQRDNSTRTRRNNGTSSKSSRNGTGSHSSSSSDGDGIVTGNTSSDTKMNSAKDVVGRAIGDSSGSGSGNGSSGSESGRNSDESGSSHDNGLAYVRNLNLLVTCPLDNCIFSAGDLQNNATYDRFVSNLERNKLLSVLVHANWMHGRDAKKEALFRNGLWIANNSLSSPKTDLDIRKRIMRRNWTCNSPKTSLLLLQS